MKACPRILALLGLLIQPLQAQSLGNQSEARRWHSPHTGPAPTLLEVPVTPFMSLLLPVVVSAVAVFVLTMVIHMTPWHKSDYLRLPDEDGVMKALRPFNIPPHDYVVPHPGSVEYMKSPEYDAKRDAGPVMTMTVLPSGPWKIGKMMGTWFLFVVVVSASMACVVGTFMPPGGNTHAVFHHVAVITFLTYAMGAVPLSIWYGRKWSTTLKTAVDSLLYALATGWIFALMWPKM